jgi:5'-3' exonuclease
MKSSKDAKEYIADAKGFYVEKEVRVLPESVAIRNLKATIRDILLTTGANEYILCMSSPANFRIELATLQEYKGNRSPDSKPVHYPLIKEYFLSEYDTNIIDPYEADDLLAIFYNEIDPDKEGKAIIVTQDKDLLQVPGWFLNLGTQKHSEYGNYGEKFQITEPLGNYNFYSQLISGDTTDNIPGIYQITGTRNSKKFSERLEFLSTKINERSIEEIEVGMYNHVFNLYLNSLGGKIKCREQDLDLDCILWEIGNLLYMHRSFDDKGWEIPL